MIENISVQHFERIDSTNLEARRLVEAGQRQSTWILADEQTGGVGRLGRQWHSPRGNLYCTLLLETAAPLSVLPQIGFVMALAVSETIESHAPSQRCEVKWPNDCLVKGQKISGILCEVLQNTPRLIAVGCGINVTEAPHGLAYPTCCLHDLKSRSTVAEVFITYRHRLDHWLRAWDEGRGFHTIAEAWQSRAIGLGETVMLHANNMHHTGVFSGIDPAGALLLRNAENLTVAHHAGDLHIPSLQNLRNTA